MQNLISSSPNLKHVLRGSNKVADCLANVTIGKLNQVVLFLDPSQYVILYGYLTMMLIIPYMKGSLFLFIPS
ncbi:hypothetical protein J1N35_022047 [Gossypium stocksii]|uniref:Uncharacterized protein n=1 Tax=Gossypium stocksii TaxID=47602 RepID=A0A9D3VFN8_9ROSI|nr:hypothetical protein J1N35_022047 [Gossypium stocksii]